MEAPRLSERMTGLQTSPTLGGARLTELSRRQGKELIGFSHGEPDFTAENTVVDAGISAIKNAKTKYTPFDGLPELKQAIEAKLLRENGLKRDLDQIVVTNGSKSALYLALLALVDPGDEVILPAPYWVSYPEMIKLAGGIPVVVPCSADDGFLLRKEDLKKAITRRTKVLILNSPNNPSGAIYDAKSLEAILSVIASLPNIFVLSDEIYEHISYDGLKSVSTASVNDQLNDRIVTINGLSKGYAMTGWRMGYAAGPRDVIGAISTLQAQTSGSPNSIGQYASIAALQAHSPHIESRRKSFQRRRNIALEALNAMPGVTCRKPAGAFYAFANCDGSMGRTTAFGRKLLNDSDLADALLAEQQVTVVPGAKFGMSPYFRISFALDERKLKEGLSRLSRFFKDLV